MGQVVQRVARPNKPEDVSVQGVAEKDWQHVCEMLAHGVKIGDALAELFIPEATYRLAMATNSDFRRRIQAARAVWDDREWPEERILEIFDRVAGGASLKETAEEMGFTPQGFHRLRQRDPYVNEAFELALKIQAEGLVDEMRSIVDDRTNDTMPDAKGGERSNGASPQRDRLRFEARKWVASKLLRETYGERTEVDVNMDVKGNLADRLEAARQRREAVHRETRVVEAGS